MRRNIFFATSQELFGIIIIGTILFIIGLSNYLLFHTVTELISIVVAFLIYVLGTKTYDYSKDNFLFFLGMGYLFLAVLNIFHTLTYYGMGVFPGLSADVPTQFWLALRFLNALVLFFAPFFSLRPLPPKIFLLSGFTLWTGLSVIAILWLRIFPESYIGGMGLTRFKVYSEYLIILIFCFALINLYFHKEYLHQNIYQTLLGSLVLSIIIDFLFTLYSDVYGEFNLLGHLFEILSIYLIYKGIVFKGLRAPFETIFLRLTESNQELKQANRYKSDFLAGMGHEMRTPLTAILAFSEDLLQEKVGKLNEVQKEHIQDILTNGKSLLIQINDLLDFSKIESGKMSLELTEVDVCQLILNEAHLLRAITQRKGIEIITQLEQGSFIIADEYKVQQVVRNLLSNALKFSPAGKQVHIRLKKTLLPVEGVHIEFEDYGIGIPLAQQKKVFDAFYQADSGQIKKYGGTGLGLALVEKIIHLHHGQIWLESEEGFGTTFYVFLPSYPDLDRNLKQ